MMGYTVVTNSQAHLSMGQYLVKIKPAIFKLIVGEHNAIFLLRNKRKLLINWKTKIIYSPYFIASPMPIMILTPFCHIVYLALKL